MTHHASGISHPSRDDTTIIICTLGLEARKRTLERAIRSLQDANRATVEILVVVNGNRSDPRILYDMAHRSDIHLAQIDISSLSAAIFAGRKLVKTPFFGFLDDDDEYLPGAVDIRLEVMHKNPTASIVVTNGFRHIHGRDQVIFRGLTKITKDPLTALFKENWLASCGALYRTDDLPITLFANIAPYLEWTWLAFLLSSKGKQVAILDQATFRIYDTEGSESKSDAYLSSQVASLEKILSQCNNKQIRKILRSRIAGIWHQISGENLQRGRMLDAWKAHLRSLSGYKGSKYITYTRHLLHRRKH